MSLTVNVPLQMIGALELPGYAHSTDAGFDLAIMEELNLRPGEKKLVSCGFKMAIPATFKDFGLFGMIVPRSSSGKLGYSLANTVGVIDSGYRGEIMLYIQNNTFGSVVKLTKFQKVAQMILVPYIKASFEVMDFLEETERASGGFGSTS